jgi:hypothetical protein
MADTEEPRIEWSLKPDGRRWTWNVAIIRAGWLCIDGSDTWHGSARSPRKAEAQMWAAITEAVDHLEAEEAEAGRAESGSMTVTEARHRLVRGPGGPIRG